jgi:hypothetical protein
MDRLMWGEKLSVDFPTFSRTIALFLQGQVLAFNWSGGSFNVEGSAFFATLIYQWDVSELYWRYGGTCCQESRYGFGKEQIFLTTWPWGLCGQQVTNPFGNRYTVSEVCNATQRSISRGTLLLSQDWVCNQLLEQAWRTSLALLITYKDLQDVMIRDETRRMWTNLCPGFSRCAKLLVG